MVDEQFFSVIMNSSVEDLDDSLSILSLSSAAEDDTPSNDSLDGYPTLLSVISPDENSSKHSSTCVSLVHSARSQSGTITALPSCSKQNNSEYVVISESADMSLSSSKVDSIHEISRSLDSKAMQPDKFNKKLYLPKVHELPTKSGAQALSAFCYHKDEMLKSLHNLHSSLKIFPNNDDLIEQPHGLAISLLDYQLKGLSWLLWRESEVPSGGLLADDMGLGKTVQMISLILKTRQMYENPENNWPIHQMSMGGAHREGGTLIVVPSTILGQWHSEIHKHVKPRYLTVFIYHGQSRTKNIHTLVKYSVVLTTYGIVQNASEIDPLKRITWERIILDEAHFIRNHRSKTAKSVFTLKGLKKWALTGTPIQNKCEDYFALMKFLQLKPFNDLVVWKKFVDNKHDSGFQRLGVISKAIMLRRTKEQVRDAVGLFEIGEKNVENVQIQLGEEEFVLYEKLSHFSKALLARFVQEHSGRDIGSHSERENEFVLDHPDIARWRRNFESMGEIKTLHILVLLLRLRQLCCHPSLARATLLNSDLETINGSGTEHQKHGVNSSRVAENFFGHDGVLDIDSPLYEESRVSSKIRTILDLLQRIFQQSTTDKVIIVSQWTSFLSLIDKFITETLGLKSAIFNGKIPVSKRQPIVDEFHSSSATQRILLLSLTAGGIGLNLVGANHIIFADLHWNPQLENQAADRIYRFGQTKNVHVYKIVCVCTIEERILRLQQKKIAIANGILDGSTVGVTANKLSINELKLLFGLEG